MALLNVIMWPVGLWLFICLNSSIQLFRDMPSWWSLAKRYRAKSKPDGQRFNFISCGIDAYAGLAPYGDGQRGSQPFYPYLMSLKLIVGEEGIHLSILFWFRPFHPPLFIPWTDIEDVSWAIMGKYTTHDVTVAIKNYKYRLVFYGRAAKALLQAFQHHKSPQTVGG